MAVLLPGGYWRSANGQGSELHKKWSEYPEYSSAYNELRAEFKLHVCLLKLALMQG